MQKPAARRDAFDLKREWYTADGKALTSGAQVGIEKSMYLSLCRAHWEEETGRWPVAKPKAKAATRKKPAKKPRLRQIGRAHV